MTTYRCMACGMGVEVEVIKELDVVEVKPCEVCLSVAEEESHERGLEEGREEVSGSEEEDVGPQEILNTVTGRIEGFGESNIKELEEKEEDTKDERH